MHNSQVAYRLHQRSGRRNERDDTQKPKQKGRRPSCRQISVSGGHSVLLPRGKRDKAFVLCMNDEPSLL